MQRNCEIIGVASGWGAQLRGCEDGADFLYKKVATKSAKVDQQYFWQILYPLLQEKHAKLDPERILPIIIKINQHLRMSVCDAMKKDLFPLVIGGDHSIAVGTWTGVKDQLGPGKKLGLIWIDAHMDSHIPSTSPSGAWHGMPLAALLGCGEPGFCMVDSKQPVLLPENVCIVGVRSFESGEEELLRRMKVKVFHMEEVKTRGFSEVVTEAIDIVTKNTDGFGVSLDLDVVDPKEAPGVGSPVGGGIVSSDLFKVFSKITQDDKLKAFEIVEYNPSRDRDERTACLALEMIGRLVGHSKPRKI